MTLSPDRVNNLIKRLPHPHQLRMETWGDQIDWTEQMLAKFRAQRKAMEARQDGDWSKTISKLKQIEASFEKDLDWLKQQR